jgi:hypothetical protein
MVRWVEAEGDYVRLHMAKIVDRIFVAGEGVDRRHAARGP